MQLPPPTPSPPPPRPSIFLPKNNQWGLKWICCEPHLPHAPPQAAPICWGSSCVSTQPPQPLQRPPREYGIEQVYCCKIPCTQFCNISILRYDIIDIVARRRFEGALVCHCSGLCNAHIPLCLLPCSGVRT